MYKIKELVKRTKKLYSQERATHSKYFFKTGPGQYGEGDVFWGLSVPEMRQIAKEYVDLELQNIAALVADKVHELRLIGLTILVEQYQKAKNDLERQKFYKFYLKNRKGINNWDLVDLSVYKLMGDYLVRFPDERKILDKLINSKNMWERRLAMISTMAFIRAGESEIVTYLAEKLLNDKEDLMHKASGWMLRELGKRQPEKLLAFLDTYGVKMPRTMLRYAIERLNDSQRQHYLKNTKLQGLEKNKIRD